MCRPCHLKKRPYASGSKHYAWKGGRYVNPAGYVMRTIGPDIARREHVLIAEKVLQRRLRPGEVVHHINGDKTDNRNCNLLICTRVYHAELHNRMAALYQKEHFC